MYYMLKCSNIGMNDLMHEFAYPNFEYPNITYYSKHVRRCTFLPVRKPDIEPGYFNDCECSCTVLE